MTRSLALRAVPYAVPGLGLAAGGYLHPGLLRAGSAPTWFWLHVVGLAFFPLVGVALAALYGPRLLASREPHRGVRPVVLLGAFGYAVLYGALDVIAGVAAAYLWRSLPDGAGRPAAQPRLFEIGDTLGHVGAACLGVAVLVVAVDHLVRLGASAVGGLLLIPGAWLLHEHHIFWWKGSLGVALLGVGTAALAYAALRAQNSRDSGSSTPRSAS